MTQPTFQEEKKLWKKGFKYVVGLDEAGRGALVGPVVAAAVILNPKSKVQNSKCFKFRNLKLRDSKKLSLRQREKFYRIITHCPYIEWGIGKVSQKMIDKINILEATKLAMKKAIDKLKSKIQNPKSKIDYLILDGNFKINISIPQRPIIKADEKVFSCAAASIIAKVKRDNIMKKEDKKYPQYGFAKHKGYPTKIHLKMLKKYGPCKIHRKTFYPIKNYLNN